MPAYLYTLNENANNSVSKFQNRGLSVRISVNGGWKDDDFKD